MSTMLTEELHMIKSRIKIAVSEYEMRSGRKVEHKEIASVLEVSQQQFSSWVNDRSWPRLDKVYKLANILGCKVDDLYEYKEDEKDGE